MRKWDDLPKTRTPKMRTTTIEGARMKSHIMLFHLCTLGRTCGAFRRRRRLRVCSRPIARGRTLMYAIMAKRTAGHAVSPWQVCVRGLKGGRGDLL